ncbi:MAG: hypothetical protein ACLTC4_07415 [Hungatella hathewayi]
MRRGYAAGWVMAGIMSVFLVGCQAEEAVRETETGAETVTEARTEAKTEMETETEPESEESFPALLYQFARMYESSNRNIRFMNWMREWSGNCRRKGRLYC